MNRILFRILITLLTILAIQACDVSMDVESDTQVDPEPASVVRFATFNIAMGLNEAGEMATALESGSDDRLRSLARVLQIVRPDVVLLAEFDFDLSIEAADLLNRNYLQHAGEGLEGISYAFSYRPTVNTGVDSGLDIDGNGQHGDPTDAWGFGRFPGQYGMMILSHFPIDAAAIRSFQTLKWSEFPDALRPINEGGESYYSDEVWAQLRLSSKNHVDIPVQAGDQLIHFLVTHPTPPGFDGPEDRNGKRNHDELALWTRFLDAHPADWLVDDNGITGGIGDGSNFIIAGDLNADPHDGGAMPGAIAQLLDHPLVDSDCIPASHGGAEAAEQQAGFNLEHSGNPAFDTSDFNDETVGNLRVDYLLPSRTLAVQDCGVFWPASNEPHHGLAEFSDHRLVWLDVSY